MIGERLNAGLGAGLFHAQQKSRRHQDGFEGQLEAFLIRVIAHGRAVIKRHHAFDFSLSDGPPVTLAHEACDEPLGGRTRIQGRLTGLHLEEAIVGRPLFGRGVVHALSTHGLSAHALSESETVNLER